LALVFFLLFLIPCFPYLLVSSSFSLISVSPHLPIFLFRFRIPQLVLRSGSCSLKSQFHLRNQRWSRQVVSAANLPRRMDQRLEASSNPRTLEPSAPRTLIIDCS
jgi:hypothetical protein